MNDTPLTLRDIVRAVGADGAVARLLLRLVAVRPPLAAVELKQPPVVYGPFSPGDLVRVVVTSDSFFGFFSTEAEATAAAVGVFTGGRIRGAPIGAFDRQDFVVSGQGDRWLAVGGPAADGACAYVTGNLRSDAV